MNIIIEKQKDTRIIDGINEILSLDDETFKKIIEQLKPQGGHLENINFFYTTDKCENPSGEIQIGLERCIDENGRFIGRAYFGAERFSTFEIFKRLEDKLKDLKEDSQEHDKVKQLLKTRDLDAYKTTLLDENRRK